MLKLLKYFRKRDLFFVLGCVVFMVGNVYLELKIPDYMQNILQLLGTNQIEIKDILTNGGFMVLFAVGSALCAIIGNFFSSIIASSLGRNVRSAVYEKVINFSDAEIKEFSTPSLITRSTNDVTQVQNIIAMGLSIMVKAPVMAVMALCKIVASHFEWTLATIIAVVFVFITILIMIIVALPKFRIVQTLTDNLNRVTREELTGTRVVRAFNAEKYQEKKFEKVNTDITNNNLFITKFMSLLDPTMTIVMSGLPLAIYAIGAMLNNQINFVDFQARALVISQMMTFSTYAIQVVMSFVMLIMIFIMLPRAQVAANRINEVLNKKPSIIDGDGINEPIKTGEVQFVNVGFKYPDAEEYVLHDISFKAERGQTIAFIGSTGSGKSTLINLVPRIYDATEGQVIVDGVNVKDYTHEQLADKVGYIAQKANLFSGTIRSNIAIGEKNGLKPSEDEIKKAIDIAQARFVYDLDGGLDAKIDQGGKNVSGGQKQRISIARAIARNPEILIFDDSFSALDYKTDKNLRAAIKENLSDVTCLIVAQRIGTIKNADKIIVLDNGRVVGEGTHDELMKSCLVYKEIALSQLSKEELKNA